MTADRPKAIGCGPRAVTGSGSRKPAGRSVLAVIALCLLAVAAAGCWDYRDLERRSSILGLAVDALPASDGKGYRITVEIPHPVTGSPSPSGSAGGGGGSGGPQSPKFIVYGDGDTLGAALISLSGRLERQPLWEHLLALALSDTLAREGVSPVIDTVMRSVFLNARARLFIVDGSASELLATMPDLQPLAARFLLGLEEQFAEFPRFARVRDVRSFDHQQQETGVALLPRVALIDNKPVAEGAAVIRAGRLEGWLDADTTEGANWWLGHIKTSTIEFPCPDGSGAAGSVTVRVRSASSSLKLERMDGGLPAFHARFGSYGRLVDLSRCPLNPFDPDQRRRLEEAAGRVITQRIRLAIAEAQATGIDFLHLGLHMRRYHPDLWKRLDWPAALPRIHVEVTSSVIIDDAGEWYRGPRFH